MALIRSKQLNKVMDGDFTISGMTTFIQTSVEPAIVVLGSQQIFSTNYSASLLIQDLGTLATTGSNATIDLGDNSF
jgi:hypothetical protein